MIQGRNAQSTLITRADVLDAVHGISWAHTQTMYYVPTSKESEAYNNGFYAALGALCVGLNLGETSVTKEGEMRALPN